MNEDNKVGVNAFYRMCFKEKILIYLYYFLRDIQVFLASTELPDLICLDHRSTVLDRCIRLSMIVAWVARAKVRVGYVVVDGRPSEYQCLPIYCVLRFNWIA